MRKYRWTTPQSRKRTWSDFAESVSKSHKVLDDTLKKHFQSSKVDMGAVKDIHDKIKDKTQDERKAWLHSHIKDVRETISLDKTKLSRSLRPGLLNITKSAGQKRMDDLYKEGYTQHREKFVVKPLTDLLDDREDKILATVDTTIDRLTGVIISNLITDTIDLIRAEMFDSMFSQRSTIDTTEATILNNMADLEAVKQSGAKLLKVWVTQQDTAVRDTHTDAEDKYAHGIPLDEDFEIGEDSMQAPGEGDDPANVCNCRCTIDYVEEEE